MNFTEPDDREEDDQWTAPQLDPENRGSDYGEPELYVLDCPICNEPTDSLKRYRFMKWCLFVFVGALWQTSDYCACPRCMRWIVVRQCLLNAVPANLVMIAIVPWGMILFAMSFLQGHSRAIQDAVNLAQQGAE